MKKKISIFMITTTLIFSLFGTAASANSENITDKQKILGCFNEKKDDSMVIYKNESPTTDLEGLIKMSLDGDGYLNEDELVQFTSGSEVHIENKSRK